MFDNVSSNNKDTEDRSEGPQVTKALVLKMPIARIPRVARKAEQILGTRVTYHRTSVDHLTNVEGR